MTIAERVRRHRERRTHQQESEMTSTPILRRAPPLPATKQEFEALNRLKRRPTIVDRVQPYVVKLWENSEFQKLVDAIDPSEAVTGSLLMDDVLAAQMVQQEAQEAGDEFLQNVKLRAIAFGMRRVLWRHHQSRPEREVQAEKERLMNGAPEQTETKLLRDPETMTD
jgi:hypothetical protein